MAKSLDQKTLKDLFAKGEKIGHYMEATGGGTPIPKGETLEEHPEAKRVMQPRDDQGRFGHNSLNLKTLKYESRGKTVPDFLRGTKAVYAKKTGNFSLIDSEGKRYKIPSGIKDSEDLVKMCIYALENGTLSGLELDRVQKKKGGIPVKYRDSVIVTLEGELKVASGYLQRYALPAERQ